MTSPDINITNVVKQFRDSRRRWEEGLESGAIVEITTFTKKFDVKIRCAMTKELFNKVFPYAEEASEDILFEERLEKMFSMMGVHAKFSPIQYCEFDLEMETNIKVVHAHDEIETFKSGRKIDTKVSIFAGRIVDDKGKQAIIFGLLEV